MIERNLTCVEYQVLRSTFCEDFINFYSFVYQECFNFNFKDFEEKINFFP